MLECGHSEACLREEEDEQFCGWCAEVADLRDDIRRLQEENSDLIAACQRRAYIVKGGELRVERDEAVGYLVVHAGGRVKLCSHVEHAMLMGGQLEMPNTPHTITNIDAPDAP